MHTPIHVLLGSLNVPGTLSGDIPLQSLCWGEDRAIHVGQLSQEIILVPMAGGEDLARNILEAWKI